MRNLWLIMKTFNTLPTDPTFRELTDAQIDLMLYSFEEDAREAELARKGLRLDSTHYDNSFEDEVWNKPVGEWEILKDGHDADKIAQQIADATREEDKENLMSKFDSLEEYNKFREEGGQTAREMEIDEVIERRINHLQEVAKMRDQDKRDGKLSDDRNQPGVEDKSTQQLNKFDQDAVSDAIKLFNGDDDDFDPL